ncbi:MAG: hypothetical protein QGG39_11950 [Candidatus Poribacteria bacterium]|nr:hypothetical protein [Candidatus Poribacteria bacterium]
MPRLIGRRFNQHFCRLCWGFPFHFVRLSRILCADNFGLIGTQPADVAETELNPSQLTKQIGRLAERPATSVSAEFVSQSEEVISLSMRF